VAAVRVDRSLPAWEQYTDFCATIVNSGIPMTLFSLGKMAFLDRRRFQMKGLPARIWGYVCLPLFLLVLPLLTHILPGMVLYCWIALPVIATALWLPAAFGFNIYQGKFSLEGSVRKVLAFVFPRAREVFLRYHIELLVEVSLRFLFIFLFHVLFNWASLVYAQGLPLTPQGYIGVLAQDWHLRSQSQCFFNHAPESSRGLVALFSWL
jgi:hypothetical protein